MQLTHPVRLVTSALDGDLLGVLASADRAFSGRELARLVDASVEGVRRALARLVEQGIVDREPVGGAVLFSLNREHLAAPAIVALVGLREELLRRIRTELAGWSGAPVYAALFGSTARGEERVDSDLDLFLMRPAGVDSDDSLWLSQVTRLTRDVSRWTGNDARVLDVGVDEVEEIAMNTSVLDDVLRDGVTLAGDPGTLRRMLRSSRSEP